MILISELIDLISTPIADSVMGIAIPPIYRTIAPLDVDFPVITMTLDSTDVQQCLDGDIKIEVLNITLNCFGNSPTAADGVQTVITENLREQRGIAGDYTVTGFYLQNRKSIDYADETTGKLVFGNQLQYRLTVKKS